MFNIASYLEKFKNIGQGERFFKEAVVSAVKEILNFEIETKNILLKNGEITFKITPAMKNAIYIKKKQILKKIEEKTGKQIENIK